MVIDEGDAGVAGGDGDPGAPGAGAGVSYQDLNAQIIDSWVAGGWEWGQPVSTETVALARQGQWDIVLTPTIPVPHEWMGPVAGLDVLGWASGGGQQMPILSVLGARCTVLDYSPGQLEAERVVAEREAYDIEIVRADMTEPLPFAEASFDLVVHPVSNCYVEDVGPIWREIARVLRPGGVVISGLDNGVNYLVDADEKEIVRGLPFNPLRDPELFERGVAMDEGIQFSHTLVDQIGGQLAAGLRITDVYEDTNGVGRLHDLGIPTFWATRAVKDEGGAGR